MTREIKFRARRIEDKEWVVGYYLCASGKHFICPLHDAVSIMGKRTWIDDPMEVDLETVGQFTGLFDCKGKGIYEGDVIIQKEFVRTVKGFVKYIENQFVVEVKGSYPSPLGWGVNNEVIGNIHNNQVLLNDN